MCYKSFCPKNAILTKNVDEPLWFLTGEFCFIYINTELTRCLITTNVQLAGCLLLEYA